MFKKRLVLMVLLAAVVVVPVQAQTFPHLLDDFDNISGWADDREPPQGTEGGIGLMQQGACGTILMDYGNTTDNSGVPNPTAGYDYLGIYVGNANLSGGSFTDIGCCVGQWDAGYRGKFDRVPSRSFVLGNSPGEMPRLTNLVDTCGFLIDVHKGLTGYGEHLREIQLYDGHTPSARNTYNVVPEGGADECIPGRGCGRTIASTPTGWTTYYVPLNDVAEGGNADLSDIVTVKLWFSSWAAYSIEADNPYDPEDDCYDTWPHWDCGDWRATYHSGKPVQADNLRLVCDEQPDHVLLVPVDIHPTSCPSPLEVKGRGKLAVAILGYEGFDVADIDVSSVALEGVPALRGAIEDVSTSSDCRGEDCECTEEGADGFDDLVLKFDKQALVAAIGTVSKGEEITLELTGQLSDGYPIKGSDCVSIRGKIDPHEPPPPK